ncbi:MAG: PTS sugar transporter subunit IIA [Candidatus Sumerlaeota bacterium]|nr:PTS sugar transporter subunit IIA [Candidatus Sumerlaeota bacterium]
MAAKTFNLASMMDGSRFIDLDTSSKAQALEQLINALAAAPQVTDPVALREAIFERERVLSTGVGIGVAIPHVKIASVTDFVIAVGRSHRGIDFEAQDGKPVHIIVMIAVSERQAKEYVLLMAQLVRLLRDEAVRRQIMFARNPKEIKEAFL